MIPVLYEIRRAFTTKTVLVLSAIIILLSVGLTYASVSGASGGAPGQFSSPIAYAYGSNGTYHIVDYSVNGYGLPVSGTQFNVTLDNGKVVSATTNSHGYANITLKNTNATTMGINHGSNSGVLYYSATPKNHIITYSNPQSMPTFENQTNSYFFTVTQEKTFQGGKTVNVSANYSRYYIFPAAVLGQASNHEVSTYYMGSMGNVSSPVKLYYMPANSTDGLSESNMTYIGQYSGFDSMKVNPSGLKGNATNDYNFALFTPSGKLLTNTTFVTIPVNTAKQVGNSFFGGEMSLLGIFVPLMAALSGYMTYGKDRTGSVLESVLVRPVSRRGLISSRYLANVSAIFISVLIAFGVSSILYDHFQGNFIPMHIMLVGLWSMLISIAGYIGLVYLASVFVKSQGALLGFAIGIYFVFDLFWSFLPIVPELILLELLKIPAGGLLFTKLYMAMYYMSPSGFPTLANIIVTGSTTIGVSTSGFSHAALGLTMTDFVILGIIWIAVPLAAAVYAFTKKD